MEIRVKARLGFPAIWAPTSVNNGPEKYRARLMIDPSTEDGKTAIKLIRETRLKVATEKWKTKAKAEAILELLKGDRNKESWFEADYKNMEGEVVEGYEGMYHLSCTGDVQPLCVDIDRTELTKRDGRPYNGCYVVAKVDIWAQDNASGKGMRAQLMGLQFWKDGAAFGGGKRAKADDFDDLSDTGEDEDATSGASRQPVEEDSDVC